VNAEELEALPLRTVVLDGEGDAWQRVYTSYAPEYTFVAAGAHCSEEGCGLETSAEVATMGPHILLAPTTDSGAERLAALRKGAGHGA
jgi:hypothetical protein